MSLILAAAVGLPFLIAIGVFVLAAIAAGRARRRRAEKLAAYTYTQRGNKRPRASHWRS